MVSLNEVCWMLTEVSSDDGSIVHPTHQPTSSQTLTPECEILVSELLPIFFRNLVSFSENLVSDKKFRIMLTEVSADDGSIVHPTTGGTSSQTLTQSGNGLISSGSEEILDILRKMIIAKTMCNSMTNA